LPDALAPEETTVVFDYEEMVERYNTALFNTLRHHQASDELDTWVPDDDPLRSILNMVEAAEISGLAALTVRVGPATLAALDLENLRAQLARLGTVEITIANGAALVHVEAIGGRTSTAAPARSADVFASVGAAYRDAIRAAAGSILHEGALDLPYGTTAFEASRDGVILDVAVDERHGIAAAAHRGTTTRVDRAIMERLCTILTGLTMQEAHDHAAIRLEYALRNPDVRRPVAGVVAPENADPAFARPVRLIHDLVSRYAATTGFRLGDNRYTARAGAAWIALDRDGRLAALNAAADEASPQLGLVPGQIHIVDLETPIKAIVAFRDDVDVKVKPRVLMQLERHLHAIEPTLQLFSVELKDANKIRRL
jgi:hypothetical protein